MTVHSILISSRLARAACLSACLALSACGGGDSSAATEDGAGSPGAAGGALARNWNINAGDWLNARLPGVPLSCDGPAVLALGADGALTWSSNYTCYNTSSGVAQSRGRFTSTGTYSVSGDRLTFNITANNAQSQVIGGPWVNAPASINSETGTYAISGNRLTLTFPRGSGGGTFTTIFTSGS